MVGLGMGLAAVMDGEGCGAGMDQLFTFNHIRLIQGVTLVFFGYKPDGGVGGGACCSYGWRGCGAGMDQLFTFNHKGSYKV